MKIKICGLFRDEDIEFVRETLPDYVGFVFAESKRKVTAEKAERLSLSLPPNIITVGVFVNEDIENIIDLYKKGVIKIAQLHGDEDEDYIRDLKKRANIPIIKAVKVITGNEPSFYEGSLADYLLLDSAKGGSGMAFDWQSLGNVQKPFFLAGGINIDNINEAMKLNSYSIDVSSGAETNGIKDFEKIKKLVETVKNKED